MSIRKSRRQQEVHKAAQNEEREVGVLARMRRLEVGRGDRGTDTGELANVSASELDAGEVRT